MNIKDFFEDRLRDETISDDWLEGFYHIASAILSDVITASRHDRLVAANAATEHDVKAASNALRRLAKIEDILETQMSPRIRRAAEVHALINQLRCVAVPADVVQEVLEDGEVRFVCVVTEGEPNVAVELIKEPSPSAHPTLKEFFAQLRDQAWFVELYEAAKRHWSPQATLQSLAVNIYLDRHGHMEENDRARWREKIFADLRAMRRAKLTVKQVSPYGGGKNHSDICTPGKTHA